MIRPRASVIIPAHDEAAVMWRCLEVFTRALPGEFDVVVVCNGCTDETSAVARVFAGMRRDVRVLEIPQASKTAALNAGDDATTVYPRIYLDVDVDVDLASLRAVVDALASGTDAAAPLPRLDLTGCGPGSRLFFTLRSRLGYLRHHALGAGVVGLSERGRARFDRFPDVLADDGFVYAHFAPEERVNPIGASFVIHVPRTLGAALRRQVRVIRGNRELRRLGLTARTPGPGWRGVLRQEPRLVPAAMVYVLVQTLARLRAGGEELLGLAPRWAQDPTSRRPVA